MITLKIAARNFLPSCTAFFNRIPTESLWIRNSNAMHLDKKFLAAIFNIIVHFVYKVQQGTRNESLKNTKCCITCLKKIDD